MCEICLSGWSEETKIRKTEGFTCEFWPEQNPEACGAPAVYQLRERIVDDHLCEAHAQELAQELGEGLMSVFQAAGVAEGETLKPIQHESGAPNGGGSSFRASLGESAIACDKCGAPAKYAEIAMTTTYFCARHRGYNDE